MPAVSKEPMVVILNDNKMSISRSSGGLSRHLSRVRSSRNYLHAKRYYRTILKKIPGGDGVYKASSRLKNRLKQIIMPGNMFENMGITYLGPADGHDLPGITALLAAAKEMRRAGAGPCDHQKGLRLPPCPGRPNQVPRHWKVRSCHRQEPGGEDCQLFRFLRTDHGGFWRPRTGGSAPLRRPCPPVRA